MLRFTLEMNEGNRLRKQDRGEDAPSREVGRSLQTQATIEVLNHPIAFARDFLELFAIHNPDSAARILNQPRVFQYPGSETHRGTTRSEHLAEIFMRERQPRGIYAILAHEQPAGQTLFHFVQAIAGSQLSDLHTVHQAESAKFVAESGSREQNFLKNFRSHTRTAPRHLHDRSKSSALQAHRKRHAYHAFLADYAHLHASTVAAEGDERGHTVIKKVDEINLLAWVMEQSVLRQVDRFKIGPQQRVFVVRERKQNDIADCFPR